MTTYPPPPIAACPPRLLCGLIVLALMPGTGEAQVRDTGTSEWSHGTTLSAFVGAGSDDADIDAVGGAAVGWEIAPHFTVEARGTWFRPGHDATIYSASVNALVPLLHGRTVAPFLAGGVGMQRAVFSATASVPEFYRRRMTARERANQTYAFDDVLFEFGGGIEVFATSHWSLRPETTVRLVALRSDVHVVPVYGLRLAYHFETHGVLNGRPPLGAR